MARTHLPVLPTATLVASILATSALPTACGGSEGQPTTSSSNVPVVDAAPDQSAGGANGQGKQGKRRGGSGGDATTRSAASSAAAPGAETVSVPSYSAGSAPVYMFMHTHHYLGKGGYYPTPAQVRDVAEAAVNGGIAQDSTLFFDGILVQRLLDQDPSVIDYVKSNGFAIGYHAEETHGPYPVVVSLNLGSMGGSNKDSTGDEVCRKEYSFDEAVNAIQYRYIHGYKTVQYDDSGYIVRADSDTDDSTTGGIRLVHQTFGRDIEVTPGHAFFNPPALYAFDNESNITLLQSAGPFAPHYLQNTRNEELIAKTNAFMGEDTTLFWFMGKLADRGMDGTHLDFWSREGFVESTGGSFRGGGGGDRGGRGGARFQPDGRGFMGLHLLPFDVRGVSGGVGGSLFGGLPGMLGDLPDMLAQVQQGGRGNFQGRGGGARGGGGKGGGEGAGRFQGQGGQAGAGDRRGGGRAASKGGAASSDTPGAATKAEAAALSRKIPQFVSFKLDGRGDMISDAIAWFKEWRAQDPNVIFVTPADMPNYVQPKAISLDAKATATAVQKYWSGGPADYLVVDGHYAALTEGFEVMARSLAGEGDRIETTNVIGPTAQASELVQGSGTVTGADVRAAAKSAVDAWSKDKHRAMPISVTVGGKKVGFHQYYWMMSEAILKGDGASISIPKANYAPPYVSYIAGLQGRANPNQTFWMEAQFWTIKPVTWK